MLCVHAEHRDYIEFLQEGETVQLTVPKSGGRLNRHIEKKNSVEAVMET